MAKTEKVNLDGEYAAVFDKLHGVCTSGEGDVEATENMFVDRFSGDGALVSVPGVRMLFDLDERINGIFLQRNSAGEDFLIVHAGGYLYRFSAVDLREPEYTDPLLELADVKSSGVQVGDNFYLFDGESITQITEDGSAARMLYGDEYLFYVPTTYINGKRNEKRNLLTTKYCETRRLDPIDDYSHGSPELIYAVVDKEKKKCAVVGLEPYYESTIYVPRYAEIDGVKYIVSEISPNAFTSAEGVTKVVTSRGLEVIGSAAFMNMKDLREVILSETVEEIGDYCFLSDNNLEFIQLGAGLLRFGKAPFAGCTNFSISYSGSEDMFLEIENHTVVGDKTPLFNSQEQSITICIPVHTPTDCVEEVYIDGELMNIECFDRRCGVVIFLEDKKRYSGKWAEVFGMHECEGGLLSTALCEGVDAMDIVMGCRISACYGGRLFITGHPSYPGLVLYSERRANGDILPLYFSDESYLNVGSYGQGVCSIASAGQSLAIATAKDGGEGNVYLYKPARRDGEEYFRLVASYGHSAVDDTYNFAGELYCGSASGISRFRGSVGRNADFEIISEPIAKRLSAVKDKLMLTSWGRYLVAASGNEIFLADATERHSGISSEYYWYPLSGIGAYSGDFQVYVYADVPLLDYLVNEEKVGEVASGLITTVQIGGGERVSFSKDGAKKYRLYQTPYRKGGKLSKITAILGFGDKLVFGAENGRLCCFNNDIVGLAPSYLKEMSNFDQDAYNASFGDTLHPYYYTMCEHLPSYKLILKNHDGGKCYLEKSTVQSSTRIMLKCMSGGGVDCSVVYDGDRLFPLGRLAGGKLDFGNVDFEDLTIAARPYALSSPRLTESPWYTKQFIFTSEGELSPFGIYSAAYRFTLSDKFKNKNI